MPLAMIGEATIRQHADAESFRRGQQYVRDGAVRQAVLRGTVLQARVEGSQYEPYVVRVAFDAGGVTQATCSCPYEYGGWCKHIVAALLVALLQPDAVETRPALTDTLAALNREHLLGLLQHLVERDPDVADIVEARLAVLAATSTREAAATPAHEAAATPAHEAAATPAHEAATPAGAPTAPSAPTSPTRRTPVDPQPLRRQMRELMRPSRHGYEYGYGASVAHAVSELLQQPLAFITGGDGENALRLLEPITEEFVPNWQELDEEGEMLEAAPEIAEAWAEALLMADLSTTERRAWAKKLEAWSVDLSEYDAGAEFDMARWVAETGWDHPALQRVLRGEAPADDPWGDDEPEHWEMLAPIWLRVLERQGRLDEYLRLAQATSEFERYTLMLVRLGRTDEAVDAGLELLTTAPGALALATTLREHGAIEAAVRIAEHGLSLEEPRAALGAWLADFAEGLNRPSLALRAAELAFASQASLAAYRRVEALAGAGWPLRREPLLTYLRGRATAWGTQSAAVDIFLSEGLVDDAIKALGDGYNRDLMRRVMDVAIGQRDDWVIKNAVHQAEAIIDAGKANHYDDAIGWLRRARDAYRASGRDAAWRAYLSTLRGVHGRKYKLMGLLPAL